MKTRFAFKQLVPMLVVFAVYGCTTPVLKSEITPKLYSGTEKNVAVGVIEARPYVLSGNKGPTFEGIFRDMLGIPLLIYPKRPGVERFVDLLSGMITDGLSDAGANVSVVSLPAGSSTDDAWKKMSATGASRYILLRVNESNWNDGEWGSPTYKYDFGVIVARKGGTVLGSKNLAADQAITRGKRSRFDNYSLTYRNLIENMFADPGIKQALGN